MGKKGGVEIQPDSVFPSPIYPALEMFRAQLIALDAFYAETGAKRVERNQLRPEHFKGWIDWARENRIGLDFNPTFFSHPKASDGFTLSHKEKGIRKFWIEH